MLAELNADFSLVADATGKSAVAYATELGFSMNLKLQGSREEGSRDVNVKQQPNAKAPPHKTPSDATTDVDIDQGADEKDHTVLGAICLIILMSLWLRSK